jgi:glycosyltransferase involved in cell wall biosynthesis
MHKQPLVSVVIPVYNEQKYLDACITSLLHQSYTNKEIIVVDDGSTDQSLQIAQKYKLHILKQHHHGPGAARNRGVNAARGEIIVLADADMRYDEKYIEKLTQPIRDKQAIGTFVKEEYVANPQNIWSRCWSCNAGLPSNRRLPENYHDTENAFRAIRKDYFLKGQGYETNEGYTDDGSLSDKINVRASNAPGAKSFHYNPSSLDEVFYSARWIGRSKLFQPNLTNFLRFTPLNSLRISIKYLCSGAPLAIILFKLVFDAGMFTGIFLRNGQTAK